MSLNLLNGNNEALSLLDWSILISEISILSHFEITKHKLHQDLRPLGHERIQHELDLLETFLENSDDFVDVVNALRELPNEAESFDLINDLKKARFLEAGQLNFLARLAETYIGNHKACASLNFAENFEIQNDRLLKLKRFFISPLREFVDHHGNVSYERHPVLKKLFQELSLIENELRTTIQRVSKTELFNPRLQLDTYDIINDRFVLAVRSDSYKSELGPIVARSNSGMTLFVEPYDVKEKGNKRIHLLSEIESTILKLTIELSKTAHQYVEEFETAAHWSLALDWLNTRASYAKRYALTKPSLNNNFNFEFNGIFHPLLKAPVRNNILLSGDKKGLIISGPNTGGKTVALKSFTLSVLMVHLGMYVPATFADIDPVAEIYYFSHDHQNLAEGLSSFASESKYYLELLENIGDKNLIIIDEIFNSTSSEEASALAIAFLDEIHLRSLSKIILSTHHQVLKTFMHAKGEYVSAHVGYDFETNRPTYKLIVGEPGSSLAFTIFDNLSVKYGSFTEISSNAKKLLDDKQITYEALLQELSLKKSELDRMLNHNRSLNIELRNQKSAMEGTLFLEREKILNDYKKKMNELLSRAEKVYEDTKAGAINSRRQISNEVGTLQSELLKQAPERANKFDPENTYAHMRNISFEEIQINMTVFSLTARKNVKVQNLNPRKKEVQIQHGALSIWVSSSTLKYPSGAKPTTPKVSIHIDMKVRGEIEIDCRGMRLEEFQNTSMQSIHEVLTGEIPFVTIVHGHGDGVLKNWLRSHLKKEHRDLQWENIEGNDGCTKIFFK